MLEEGYLDKFKIKGASKINHHKDVSLPNCNMSNPNKVVCMNAWKVEKEREFSWG